MWPKTFADRLAAWDTLRQQAIQMDKIQALSAIESWWLQTPWTAYHLHWDDQETWPDPWQLLDDNIYCELARGLGILYTITLIDRPDLQNAVLTEVGGDNLVLVDQEKYILNWPGLSPLNISPNSKNLQRRISQQELKQKIR
jgi:hypothetical protein